MVQETAGEPFSINDHGTEKMLHGELRMTAILSKNLGSLKSRL